MEILKTVLGVVVGLLLLAGLVTVIAALRDYLVAWTTTQLDSFRQLPDGVAVTVIFAVGMLFFAGGIFGSWFGSPSTDKEIVFSFIIAPVLATTATIAVLGKLLSVSPFGRHFVNRVVPEGDDCIHEKLADSPPPDDGGQPSASAGNAPQSEWQLNRSQRVSILCGGVLAVIAILYPHVETSYFILRSGSWEPFHTESRRAFVSEGLMNSWEEPPFFDSRIRSALVAGFGQRDVPEPDVLSELYFARQTRLSGGRICIEVITVLLIASAALWLLK